MLQAEASHEVLPSGVQEQNKLDAVVEMMSANFLSRLKDDKRSSEKCLASYITIASLRMSENMRVPCEEMQSSQWSSAPGLFEAWSSNYDGGA